MTKFLKQYGEKRTGTNYLRALLLANCPDTVPLMHILGDKHSPPVPLEHYRQNTPEVPDRAFEFVKAATFAAPAESTRPDDVAQLEHMRSLAMQIDESVSTGQLGFLISVKHPCAWAASFAKYYGWMVSTDSGQQMSSHYAKELERACHDFNLKHKSWLDHSSRFSSRTVIVRFEELLENPVGILSAIVTRFGLQQIDGPPALFERCVAAADWDHSEIGVGPKQFDPSFYHEKRFLSQLSRPLWDIVMSSIDWELAAAFGYNRF